MAFRKKANAILAEKPDILIVQECENFEKIKFESFLIQPTDKLWYGFNPHKGIGIFTFNGYRLKLNDWHNPEIRTFLPISIAKNEEEFLLYVVWAFNPLEPEFKYIGQVWKAVNYYKHFLSHFPSIIVGDFNSNTIWDRRKSSYDHSSVVQFLQDLKIHSVYHYYHKQVQGREIHPTLYLYRQQTRPYHIDYCFASQKFADAVSGCRIGAYAEWIKLSDHMPLIIDFEQAHQ